MSNFNILFVVSLLVLIVSVTKAFKEKDNSQESEDLKLIRLMTKLQYGDPCSWQAEKLRGFHVKELFSGKQNLTTKMEFQSMMLKRGEPLCNALELLVCSRDTNTCICGDPIKYTLLQQKYNHKNYVVEKDDNGQQKCRWAKKSYCVSDDFYKRSAAALLVNADSKCQGGTSCLTTEKQTTCKFSELLSYVLNNGLTDTTQIIKELYSGKMCSCQEIEENDTQTDKYTTENRQPSHWRVRRFVNAQGPIPDVGVYGGILAPFVDSI